MSFNSLKVLALTATVFGAVACGKGVGEKNNLKIDGTYEIAEIKYSDENKVEKTEKPATLQLVKIEDNVATTYAFSDDNKSVEISKTSLTIKGRKLIGQKTILDNCQDAEGSVSDEEAQEMILDKSSSGLTLTTTGATITLKSIKKDEFNALTDKARLAKLDKACLNEQGKVVKKLTAAEVIASEEEAAAIKAELKAKADKEKEERAQDEVKADEVSSINKGKLNEVSQFENSTYTAAP